VYLETHCNIGSKRAFTTGVLDRRHNCLLVYLRTKSAKTSPQQCTHSAPDFIPIGLLSAELLPNDAMRYIYVRSKADDMTIWPA